MDDIKPPRNFGSGPTPTNYGRSPTQQTGNVPPSGQQYAESHAPDQQSHDQVPAESYKLPQKKTGKKRTIALWVLVVLTLAAGAFAAWEFMQIRDLQTQVDELKQENARLTEKVYSINYDNRDLRQKLELTTTENDSLKELNDKLLETCGAACSTIIP